MSRFQHILFFVAIVFVASFGLLTQARAETVRIENYVSAHSSTGGVMSSGQDGQDGQDGLPGQDGQDGLSGKNGADGRSYISGDSDSTVKIEASVDGKTVVDIVRHASGTSESDTWVESKMEVGSTSLPFDDQQTLVALLDKIRLIFLNYVLAIF
ncbi:hypothetical protein A2392_01840 [Candidatus Kaiserbacteria bacterium RIFOXYB1_FULL_46_14]|uniref:Collagen-like protein n=1 Tax=Candidatus Kaiserbacteria bacterium RIFOXYB1_FULL_46_14 TaxID=1798531 RepID=A0A1F6FK07_9BACT|nr:MAG: hypothetical protein A2392_01840 [Candidatus Kaiserbacteria bacterium RIFOXYB1_FULL_46_14]